MSTAEMTRPRRAGGELRALAPATLVVFGATGDLARRKLLPALYNLAHDRLLPGDFHLIGSARTPLGDEEFRRRAAEAVRLHSRREPDEEVLAALLRRFQFLPGDSGDPALHADLARRLELLEDGLDGPANRLFYLSTAPELFSPIVERLGGEGLQRHGDPGVRVLIEKPFGRSAAEARDFNATLHSVFAEEQVYRVDHYLGKEEVQNILALRFANSMIETFWNRGTIASVQITAAEEVGVGGRAGYYEGAGALRDHLQNHMLQLLCMIAMEPPADLSAAAVRDQKVRVLEAVAPPGPEATARARYAPGRVDGEPVPGYLEEEGVAPGSRTETYAAMRLAVATPRWEGVPFYLRTGKRLARRETEIAIALRPSPHPAFLAATEPDPHADELVIGLRPNAGVRFSLATKVPGAGMRMRPAPMQLGRAGDGRAGEAYERLLLDALRGDPTLFTRADEIEGQWRICDPVLRRWEEDDAPLPTYPAGSQGPAAAAAILAPGDAWRPI
jgi:glucose-6-phosphate 1-dehydrogenase